MAATIDSTALSSVLEDWAEGVNTSLADDRLPPNASPRGWNSVFKGIGSGRIGIGKRMGFSTVNRTPITGSPAILGQYCFRKSSGGAYTNYHLVASDGGRLDKIVSGSASAADVSAATPFTAGTNYPDFDTANNLCFMVNGTDRKKFDGTSVTNFGITRPTVGTMAGAAGAAGSPNGTYELRVTYVNTTTGHESSASNTASATVTVVNQKISVTNIPVSADGQVNARNLYVRNTATQPVFYLGGTISDNSSTSVVLDFLDANLITQAPDTEENNPPPSDARYCCWHVSRMFVATPNAVYYSKLDKPESFDPDNVLPINPEDGQQIRSIFSAFEVLLIFKDRSLYALYGTDPNSWQVRLVLADVGCISNNTVVAAEGTISWLAETGLMTMNTLGQVNPVGATYLGGTFNDTTLAMASLSGATAVADPLHYRILLAVPESGQTRNTRIIAYNYRVGRFEADKWDPMDVGDLSIIYDSTNNPVVMLGGYAGQVFQGNTGYIDGVASGTVTGIITGVSGGSTVFADSLATFDTTGGGLIERTVYFVSPDGATVFRRRITANSGTTVTAAAAPAVVAGWTYYIGGIDWQWDTGWLLVDPRFYKKRLRHLYAIVEANTTIAVDLMRSFGQSVVERFAIVATTGGSLWGTMIWGTSLWGSSTPYTTYRYRVGLTGTAVKLRLRNRIPNMSVNIAAVGINAELKSDRVN